MAEFRIPNKIVYGEGTVKELNGIKGHRLLLVYDNPHIRDLALKLLLPSGITVRPFEADSNYTDISQIKEGTKALMEFKPEWVLAAGGHGAMDLAKLIRIFYQRPDLTFDDVTEGKASDISLDKTRLIALPLFNTDGGEATCSAFFADINAGHYFKIHNPALMPDITVIDPDLLCCSSGEQQALCILSTFVLAVEAAVSTGSSSFVRPLALEAISILAENVPAHSAVPTSGAPLLYAQCLAGITYTNASPGICSMLCRAVAQAIGLSSLGGLGAALLPAVIRHDKQPDKYLDAAKAMGLCDAAALADAVREYADMLGLPLTIKEMGVSKNLFLKTLSKVSHRVLTDLSHPHPPTGEAQKDIEQILRAAYSTKD